MHELLILITTKPQETSTNATPIPLDPTASTSGTGYHQWLSSLATVQYTNNLFIPPTTSDVRDGLAFVHWIIILAISEKVRGLKGGLKAVLESWRAETVT